MHTLPKVCVGRLLLYLHEAAAQVVYRHPGDVLSSSSNHLTTYLVISHRPLADSPADNVRTYIYITYIGYKSFLSIRYTQPLSTPSSFYNTKLSTYLMHSS